MCTTAFWHCSSGITAGLGWDLLKNMCQYVTGLVVQKRCNYQWNEYHHFLHYSSEMYTTTFLYCLYGITAGLGRELLKNALVPLRNWFDDARTLSISEMSTTTFSTLISCTLVGCKLVPHKLWRESGEWSDIWICSWVYLVFWWHGWKSHISIKVLREVTRGRKCALEGRTE